MTHAQTRLYPLTSPQRQIGFDQIRHEGIPLYNIGDYVNILELSENKGFVNLTICFYLRKFYLWTSLLFKNQFYLNLPQENLIFSQH
jgi:hypothetical protein